MDPYTKLRIPLSIFLLTVASFNIFYGIADERNLHGTVAFATVGRAHYAFDIYSVSLHPLMQFSGNSELKFENLHEVVGTDGESVNYNGHFLEGSALEIFLKQLNISGTSMEYGMAYVSERGGMADLYLNLYIKQGMLMKFPSLLNSIPRHYIGEFSRREEPDKVLEKRWVMFELGRLLQGQRKEPLAMKDRPAIAGNIMVYVSTRKPSGKSRKAWVAVYSTHIQTGKTRRLTPSGIADYSPAVSPSGEWVMVASAGEKGWQGEIHDLETDLYIFRASDGSNRRLVVKHGGWPSWADDYTVFFHRQAEDGWWSIYRATLSNNFLLGVSEGGFTGERVTPPGIHAFTPAASPTGRWIAVSTRRPDSNYRHIEIFDLLSKEFIEVTKTISPNSHHFNPFVSFDRIGYHKCRGGFSENTVPVLEKIKSPLPYLSAYRIDGTFPSFSPDGSLIAFIPNIRGSGVYVMRLDGSGKRKIFTGSAFGTAWDWKRSVVYTSHGPGFATEKTTVDIVAISNADKIDSGENSELSYKTLTTEGNNAFPSPSPDGKFVVFRSGRSGYKNLYIMDSEQGEEGGLWQLTEGPWTDTMCNWSPDGEWIAFASDRDNPGGSSFALYFIHPNGTGLQRVLNSSTAGRVNHPWFSPDSKSLVFTSDYAGVSAEPISVPHQFQPYGEIFIAKVDGSNLHRLTHNAYEDGTPSWGRIFIAPSDLAGESENLKCDFEDDRWLGRMNGYLVQSAIC
eukprot:Gb_31671 [translate_table: standard]